MPTLISHLYLHTNSMLLQAARQTNLTVNPLEKWGKSLSESLTDYVGKLRDEGIEPDNIYLYSQYKDRDIVYRLHKHAEKNWTAEEEKVIESTYLAFHINNVLLNSEPQQEPQQEPPATGLVPYRQILMFRPPAGRDGEEITIIEAKKTQERIEEIQDGLRKQRKDAAYEIREEKPVARIKRKLAVKADPKEEEARKVLIAQKTQRVLKANTLALEAQEAAVQIEQEELEERTERLTVLQEELEAARILGQRAETHQAAQQAARKARSVRKELKEMEIQVAEKKMEAQKSTEDTGNVERVKKTGSCKYIAAFRRTGSVAT